MRVECHNDVRCWKCWVVSVTVYGGAAWLTFELLSRWPR